tara:strand:- start:324 stop:521 length:198 start_codon:yes stop_codon:yes gene_type:complete
MPSAKIMVQDGFECREMNADELAQYKIDQAAAQENLATAEAKTEEKTAILERLGLSAEELTALLS